MGHINADPGNPGSTHSPTTWQLLRAEPRFTRFIAGLAPGALVIGAATVTRAVLATETFGDETGIATVAIAAGLAGAAGGLISGVLADRWNARWILLISMSLLGLTQLVTFAVYSAGGFTPTTLTALSSVEGFLTGVQVTALLTTQAGLVSHNGRGAAEITNALRVGIGSVIGTLIATYLLPLQIALGFQGVLTLVVAGITVWTSTTFRPASNTTRSSLGDLVAVLRANRVLRSTLVIDFVLSFVIPTQLVNLFIVDKDLPGFLGVAVIAGFLGVLGARIHLAITGLRGSLPFRVRLSYLSFILTVIASLLVLLTESQTLLVYTAAPLIALGSWTSTLSYGLVNSAVQQRLPDEVRGRLSGATACARGIAVAGGVLAAGLVITPQNTEWFLLLLASALVIVAVATRGFSPLADRSVTTA